MAASRFRRRHSIGRAPASSGCRAGGAYAVANIRGGGEFGPSWHDAALKLNRQKAYDDFIAVAEDMIRRGLTTPKQLGIMGGSNGGLLVGAVTVQRPDLFGAVVCQVPLLDMIRFSKIGAGASWVGEYGDPENPVEREAILKYSPYQNVKRGVNISADLLHHRDLGRPRARRCTRARWRRGWKSRATTSCSTRTRTADTRRPPITASRPR